MSGSQVCDWGDWGRWQFLSAYFFVLGGVVSSRQSCGPWGIVLILLVGVRTSSGLHSTRSLGWILPSLPLPLSLSMSLAATGATLDFVPPPSTINAVPMTWRSRARPAAVAMLPTIKTMAARRVPNWVDDEGPQSSENDPRNFYGPHRGRCSRVGGLGGAGRVARWRIFVLLTLNEYHVNCT